MSCQSTGSIRLIAKYLLLSFIILSLISSSAFAKKPIKLTDREMAEVEGAFLPAIILGALVVGYLENVVVDLAMNAEYRAAWKETAVDLAHKDWDAAAESAKPLAQEPIKAAKNIDNIIYAPVGFLGKVASANKFSQTIAVGTVKGAERAFFEGIKKGAREEGAQAAYEIPLTCLKQNEGQLNLDTVKCVGQTAFNRVADGTAISNVLMKGAVRKSAYEVRSGTIGTQLKRNSELSGILENANNLTDAIERRQTINTSGGIRFADISSGSKPSQTSNTSQNIGSANGGGGGSGRSSSTAVTFDSNRVLANIKQGVAEVNKATGQTGSPFNISRAQAASAAPAAKTTSANQTSQGYVFARSYVRTIADNKADVARRTAAISGTPKSSSSTSSSKPSSSSKSSSSSRSSSSGRR